MALSSRALRAAGIVTALAALAVVAASAAFLHSRRASADKVASRVLEQTARTVIEKTVNYLNPALVMTEQTSRLMQTGVIAIDREDDLEAYLVDVLKTYPQLAMFNLGDENGNFTMPKKLPDGTIATKVIRREPTPSVTWKYRDLLGRTTRTETGEFQGYDPRVRPWYVQAKENGGKRYTDVYIFFTDKKPGITASYPLIDTDGAFVGVAGLDIELAELSQFLQQLQIGPGGMALIVNSRNEIVAHPEVSRVAKRDGDRFRLANVNDLGASALRDFFQRHEESGKSDFTFKAGGEEYAGVLREFPESFEKNWRIAVLMPREELGHGRREQLTAIAVAAGAALVLVGSVVGLGARRADA